MKKIFVVFCALFFTNVSLSYGMFFYADALESAIQEEFPENLQMTVAAEYEAQMNPNTGEIDANGMYNVCYAGGYDVSEDDGAKKCGEFVKKVQSKCVYVVGNGLRRYNNPANEQEKIKKCIFDKTMDYVFEYDGGFQQTQSDRGNRICKNGVPLKDARGNYLLGATSYGITTCASELSVDCIRKMTKKDARHYYWTRIYHKYKYYKLPDEVLAAVMEFAVGGVGTVAKELKETVGAQHCSGSVISDCVVDAINKYLAENTVDDFYDKISALRAKNRAGKAKERALGIRKLLDVYMQCAEK